MEVWMERKGRATVLTPRVQEIIVDAITSGGTDRTAIAAAGISRRAYYYWLVRGRAGEEPYSSFAEAVLHADAVAQGRCLRIIDQAGPKDWRAAAWWLERRHPDEWGRHPRVDVAGLLDDLARGLAARLGIPEEVALEEAQRLAR
jgi:transposase